MQKKNLPVIILRGVVLLPNNDIKLEVDDESSKTILDTSEYFHDNNVLIISQLDTLEEKINLKQLPKIGVIAKIVHKIDLPNGKKRIIISAQKRAQVEEYLNLSDNLDSIESIVEEIEQEKIEPQEESTFIRKLYKEVDKYIKSIPYISNSFLAIIKTINNLEQLTDTIIPHLMLDLNRFNEYLNEISAKKRATMILEDIYKEKEMFDIEKNLDLKVKHELDKSQREYILKEKLKTIKTELNETSPKETEVDKLKKKLQSKTFPSHIKEKIELEINKYDNLPSLSPEISMVREYIDWLLNIPWGVFTSDNDNLKDVRNKLDQSHYGLEDIKTRIIEYLAVKQQTNSLKSPILCLIGPPGVGKTSLAISIAQAMNRNFVKMSVGGVHDEAEIKGHRRAYLGANPGRIIRSIKKAKSMNPVFLIDEIDKMAKDIKGDPASALLEVLDPEQNKYFSDHYIEENVDLSNVMFIATANYIENISTELRDRLELINISGYTEYEKLDIAKKHLIAKVEREHGIKKPIKFTDKAILKIINNYTMESGVRELERLLAKIIRKIVVSIVVEKKKSQNMTIKEKDIVKYLDEPIFIKEKNSNNPSGVVNGLSYSTYGGDVLKIEVAHYKGTGKIILTGSLGNVMQESAQTAYSYVKSNYKDFNLELDELLNSDIHIHAPEGAIKKEGPSAGIALTTAIISSFNKKKIKSNIAMTGEITLRGEVLPIGGLKEKSIGAKRNGVDTVIIPKENERDIKKMPQEITDTINFIVVNDYKEVYSKLM